MKTWADGTTFPVILLTIGVSKIFEEHCSKIEQVSFAEGTENPKGHCDLASWAKGRESARSRGGSMGGG